MSKVILVTGGAGFIGSHIVDRMIARGYRVIVVDNLVTGRKTNVHPKAIFVRMDIQDKRLASIFKKYRPSIVSHFAAQMDVRKSVADPLFDAQTNILGTIHLLELSRIFHVKKFIFASSGGAVYGETKVIPTRETHSTHPISPYGVAKLAGEQYCYYYWKEYGLSYVALRSPNIYGPRQRSDGEAGVVAIFTKKLLEREQPIINGTGKQTRDYLYVKDVVRAHEHALCGSFVGSVNIGTGIETTVNDLFYLLVAITGTRKNERHGPAKSGEQMRSAVDIRLAQKVLRWTPTVSLRQGLQKTVEWFRLSVNSARQRGQ